MSDDAAVPDGNFTCFDRPNGDVALRSSDGFHHRVHKVILSEASPFFATMFSLPQNQIVGAGPQGDREASDIPVVPVTEDSRTLTHLLRLCYPSPLPPPSFLTLDEVESVLDASSKYETEVVRAFCMSALETHIKTEPIAAYGLALRLRLKKEASAAALESLKHEFPPAAASDDHDSVTKAISRMTGMAVYRLVQYREACKAIALRQFTHDLAVLKPPRNGVMVYICPKCSDQEPGLNTRYLPFKLDVAKFRERATRVVGARPCGAALLGDPEIGGLNLVAPNSLENKCPFCTANILKVLNQLMEHLARIIDEQVSAIELKLDF
ncbi:hypothetical protein DAEQUDRAFT_140696 [Daedalea quercina L-15889]|uniref:BTB domain-containing protein n=1 Tax=Daedalea quercina L-15889 TaxID=1314783 RepID=A0A165RUF4_9APHY|nr:hypothetical protein DAEQUDRAFT_140696 [Daedalea quercina L-15889]